MLNDKSLRKIAMKSGSKRTDLGYMLDLESTDIDQILCKYNDPTDQAFRILVVSRQEFRAFLRLVHVVLQ